jgi:uncharacterized RDD family membrane protein YckC
MGAMGIIRSALVNRATAALARRNDASRCDCGARLIGQNSFCPQCGAGVQSISASVVAGQSSALARRVLAELIDRLAPLPFIAYFFPPWALVVVAFHLICDGPPSGRSPGKWLCRLRVVAVSTGEPCGVRRSTLRRLPTAIGQAAYCCWFSIPFVLGYDLVSLAFVWLNRSGRRPEDYLAGTRVITEAQYKKLRPGCLSCGERIPAGARCCVHCGARRTS